MGSLASLFNSEAVRRAHRRAAWLFVALISLCGALPALSAPTLPDVLAAAVSTTPARAAADLANAVSNTVPNSVTTAPSLEAPSSSAASEESSAQPTTPTLPKPIGKGLAGSKPLIILDPGHGGVDNGATAPNGDH